MNEKSSTGDGEANENVDHTDSADDVVSMNSDRSRSVSRERRSPTPDPLSQYIHREIQATISKSATESDKSNAAEGTSNDSTKQVAESDARQVAQGPQSENELSNYDIELKKLESHNERLTQPDNKSKPDSDTGQNDVQSQKY